MEGVSISKDFDKPTLAEIPLSKEENTSCPTCRLVCETPALVEIHIRLIHKFDKIIKCPVCEEVINRNEAWVHVKNCEIGGGSGSKITKKIKNVKKKEAKPMPNANHFYLCKNCGEKFKETKDIMEHVKICTQGLHSPEKKTKIQTPKKKQKIQIPQKKLKITEICKICRKVLDSNAFKTHNHCEKCNLVFDDSESFKDHKHFSDAEVQTDEKFPEKTQ